ncbi:MAG: LLM class flavin-dependent oxidoreductase [Rhodospirillaceae bacterium]|nr:LLM class flavin-dependent oxidoreductase [Rhodospirillaceae bacterium]
MVALSVLDLSFMVSGGSGPAALRNTVDLARLVDGLGYRRFWVAEHHNLPSVASPAPEIMIGQIAAATRNLRVGAGGVMLPNHAPLLVAERYKVLEALFPGRIDLGIGRAPGTDQLTAFALRRRHDQDPEGDFLDRLQELMAWDKGFTDGHPFRSIRAMPADVGLPPIWVLGSSGYGAALAASIGVGYAFAHHFAAHDATDAMLGYRRSFRPSGRLERPYAILAVAVVCADTDAEAEWLAGSIDLMHLRRSHGEFVPVPSPEEAAGWPYTEADRARIRQNRARLTVGSPATVLPRLAQLVAATQADELMVTTPVHDHAARRRSYELLAGIAGEIDAVRAEAAGTAA